MYQPPQEIEPGMLWAGAIYASAIVLAVLSLAAG